MRAWTPSETTSAALVREQRRDLRLVGLELLEGGPDRRVLVGRVLQLDHGERQAVDEQHDVRPARVLPLGHRELVDGEPVVVAGRVEVDDLACAPAIEPSLRRYSTVTPSTSIRWTARLRSTSDGASSARQLAVGVLQRLGRQVGVEAHERLAQPALQHDVAVVRVAALGARLAAAIRGRAAPRSPALQPGEGGVLDDGFGRAPRAT